MNYYRICYEYKIECYKYYYFKGNKKEIEEIYSYLQDGVKEKSWIEEEGWHR